MKRVAAMTAVTLLATVTLAAQLPPMPLIPPGGLWGPIPSAVPSRAVAAPSLPLAPAPRSTTDMATVNPSATVTIDDHDTPIEASVADAQKSGTILEDHTAHIHPAPAPQAPTASDPHAGHTHTAQPARPTTRQPDHPTTRQPTKQPSNSATQQPKPPKPRTPATPKRQAIYACPMHPEVTSTKPGTCPKCGMTLEKK